MLGCTTTGNVAAHAKLVHRVRCSRYLGVGCIEARRWQDQPAAEIRHMGKTLTRAIQNPSMTRWEEKAEGGLPGVTVGRDLPDPITVSVICPTLHRQHLHEQIYQYFTSQTHEHQRTCGSWKTAGAVAVFHPARRQRIRVSTT